MIDFLINISFPYEVFIEMSSVILIPRTMEFYIYIKVKERKFLKNFKILIDKDEGNWLSALIFLFSQFLIFILCAIFIYFSSFKEF